jgi:hypothetical protein
VFLLIKQLHHPNLRTIKDYLNIKIFFFLFFFLFTAAAQKATRQQ